MQKQMVTEGLAEALLITNARNGKDYKAEFGQSKMDMGDIHMCVKKQDMRIWAILGITAST